MAGENIGVDDDGQMEWGERDVVLVRWGWRAGGLTSSLTCNAVLGCINQSSPSCQWEGLGQRLTTAKESSRSYRESEGEGEKETEYVRGKSERESQQCAVVSCAPGLSLQQCLYNSPLCTHLPQTLLSSILFLVLSHLLILFLTLILYYLCFSNRFLFLHSTFHSLHPASSSSNPSSPSLPGEWSRRLTPALFPIWSFSLHYIPWASVHLAGKSKMCVCWQPVA